MSNEASVEQEIQSKNLNAPRLTPADIDACIVSADYHVFPGTTSTVCRLGLRNGFSVIGHSACVAIENFDAELGRKIAYDQARSKVWELEGYLLREQLFLASRLETTSFKQRVEAEKLELDTKLGKLIVFFDTATYQNLNVNERDRLSHQAAVMTEYSAILRDRIATFPEEKS